LHPGTTDVSQLAPESGDPLPESLAKLTRLFGQLFPEAIALRAVPMATVQGLLRELEGLRDQLQSAGGSAIDWLVDREVVEWLLLALVVAVTAEIVRREFWHAEEDLPLIDGEGAQIPWLV